MCCTRFHFVVGTMAMTKASNFISTGFNLFVTITECTELAIFGGATFVGVDVGAVEGAMVGISVEGGDSGSVLLLLGVGVHDAMGMGWRWGQWKCSRHGKVLLLLPKGQAIFQEL